MKISINFKVSTNKKIQFLYKNQVLLVIFFEKKDQYLRRVHVKTVIMESSQHIEEKDLKINNLLKI